MASFTDGKYEITYKNNRIKVINKMNSMHLYINDELVAEEKSIMQNCVALEGKLNNGEVLVAVGRARAFSVGIDIFAGRIENVDMQLESRGIDYSKFTGMYNGKKISVFATSSLEMLTVDNQVVLERPIIGNANARFEYDFGDGNKFICYEMGLMITSVAGAFAGQFREITADTVCG